MASILIVEDEPRISSFVERGLTDAGFTCQTSADGSDALNQAESGRFDLMVLDIGIPSLDGWEVLRRLRLVDKQMPVLILSARRSLDATVLGLDSGANDYMVKPFKMEELKTRIGLLLDARGAGESHGSASP